MASLRYRTRASAVGAQRHNHQATSYVQNSNFTVYLLPPPQSRTAAPSFYKVDRANAFDLQSGSYPLKAGWRFSRDQYTEYKNNKFKILAPTWNDIFDLPDGSYSIADIQDYFLFMIKKHETFNQNPSVQIYPNEIKTELFLK